MYCYSFVKTTITHKRQRSSAMSNKVCSVNSVSVFMTMTCTITFCYNNLCTMKLRDAEIGFERIRDSNIVSENILKWTSKFGCDKK